MRNPLVSASHTFQASSDALIGKKEAYILVRKKNEKWVLRKEGNEYVADFFVKVTSGATAPIKNTPKEVDAINQVADGREQRKKVTCDCSKPMISRAGGVSEEDMSKRAETVRPQHDEHRERQFVCDSAAMRNVDDIELNGATNDEDMDGLWVPW